MDKQDIGYIAAILLTAIYAELTLRLLMGVILMALIALCWLAVRSPTGPQSVLLPLALLNLLVFISSIVMMHLFAGVLLMALITLCWYGVTSYEARSSLPIPVVILCGLVLAYTIATMQLLFGIIVIVLVIVSACCILPAVRRHIRL